MTRDILADSNDKTIFEGLAISSGKVVGQACLYSADKHKSFESYALKTDEDVRLNLERFDTALAISTKELESLAADVATTIGKAESEIFLTQRDILNDPAIVRKIREGVEHQRINVESIISQIFKTYEDKFLSMQDKYFKERATDIGEISRRLISRLNEDYAPQLICEGQAHCTRGANRIVVADELTSDMIVNMRFERVLGFITEHGGLSSHAAIMARSLGVPAVSGLRGIMKAIGCGASLLLDGDSGTVYLNPTSTTIKKLIPIEPVDTSTVCYVKSPGNTIVAANASLMADVEHAQKMNADGIGLFRTEMLFLKANRLLTEDEQFAYYSQISERMKDKMVTFRCIDVGGDKPLPFLRIEQEANPYLGWRGARFLLGSPDIFSMQLRALLRVSVTHKIRIMFPMVVDETQQKLLNAFVAEVMPTVPNNPENIELGAMFEVPSACMQADKIMKLVDFASIGSNDLIQYTFAVDRNNELVSSDYNPDHPVLWDLLSMLSTTAHTRKKSLSLCGEMAGREGMPTRLLNIGITSLSVTPRIIPRIRAELVSALDEPVRLRKKPAPTHKTPGY